MKTKVFVAGHRGLVGSALCRRWQREATVQLLTVPRSDLDLRDGPAVDRFFEDQRPNVVLLAAARVGGIRANQQAPVEFLLDNLQIQNNVLSASHRFGVDQLLVLGSSCFYPRLAEQPIAESALLTGPLEPTNEPYALAKIAGVRLAQAYWRQYGCRFFSVLPANLYGPNDNFCLESSHVIPALLRKFHEAKTRRLASVTLWGTGTPRREFLHVDDLADACWFVLHHYDSPELINIGCGQDWTIAELAGLIARIVDYAGDILWDASQPDGAPRRLLDTRLLLRLGWRPRLTLEDGLRQTYQWYLQEAARRNAQ